MTEKTGSTEATSSTGIQETLGGTLRFLGRHWRGLLRGAAVLALVVVVLQNIEPTSIDVLFWSIHGVPKLVLLTVFMALGAALWEIGRRLLRAGPDRAGAT